jgi:uridine kinase
LKDIDGIILNLLSRLKENNRFIVGIDGLSRSGKTTLTSVLREQLHIHNINVVIFHMDDYIVERSKRYNTDQEQWFEYYGLQWNVLWLREHLFGQLRACNQLFLPKYDSDVDAHSEQKVTLPQKCMIIIEGVFLQRKEWRGYFDYVIYLDCPKEVRFSRESEETRRNIEKFINRYWKAEDHYLSTEDPIMNANLLLSYTSNFN